jgi:hypothetical protein
MRKEEKFKIAMTTAVPHLLPPLLMLKKPTSKQRQALVALIL